jgi:phenylalanyl-tRNA synthetase beta chain
MKFTLSWLKRHLDTDASLEQICASLTAIGLELEGLENPAEDFAAFKVALVTEAEKHPDADRLQVLSVKFDGGETKLVCGAPNARAGMKGVFAPEGAYIPGSDMVLKKANIRGVDSIGMMVSESEMGLSDEHDGIIEVDDSFEIGTPMVDVFGLNDPIIEINLTPNRADCAGVRGIARDLAAAGLGELIDQDESGVNGGFKSSVNVTIDDAQGCPMFLGREIKGVKNSTSPDWMQRQLKAIGLRPISALVDITNFVTFDQGRPLHVYDVNKLQGDIRVGSSKGGEELEALNDKTYTLVPDAVTINDDSGVIGLGGIVGGTSTGCEDDATENQTSDVFLEAAYFDPMRIARAGRDLAISSDARYRLERGVDPEFTRRGIEMATRLILEICGGEASEVVQAGDVPDWKHDIEYDYAHVEKLMGFDVAPERQDEILISLGFEKNGNSFTPPSWRGDVHGAADLVEEVARIQGFEHIPSVSVTTENLQTDPAETVMGSRMRKARTALAVRGLYECVTWSFMADDMAGHFSQDAKVDALKLKNPISNDLNYMRPSILPNLAQAAARNADKGLGDTALCEVGPVFRSVKTDGQDMVATGLRAGRVGSKSWVSEDADRAVDAYDAKADAMSVLAACGVPDTGFQITRETPSYYHPGRSGALKQGKKVLAYFGELHPGVLQDMDLKQNMSGFEVFLANVPQSRAKGTAKKLLKLNPLQSLNRDFAFIVSDDVDASVIAGAVRGADKNLISDIQIFDIYVGQGIDDGHKSVALSVTIQPKDKTLTDEEIETLSQAIIDKVTSKTGAVLRG